MTTKTLTLGNKPPLKGIEVSAWSKELLAKTTYAKKKETLNLAILTPADLGFTTYPTTTELYARAKEKGYDLCPAEPHTPAKDYENDDLHSHLFSWNTVHLLDIRANVRPVRKRPFCERA